MKKSVVLIGMPGCGKSSVGVVLAKALGYNFIDSDLVIQEAKGKLLSEIIAEVGPDGFNKIEEEINCTIKDESTVIATGGSVIYGPKAMEHFRNTAIVVYIKLDCNEIKRRLGDFVQRGISFKDGQTLEDLYEERVPLYEKYAHIIVDTSNLEISESMDKIRNIVTKEVEALCSE
ncbi:MAG: shikimate kinase [Anaerovoracaceae bacterium]